MTDTTQRGLAAGPLATALMLALVAGLLFVPLGWAKGGDSFIGEAGPASGAAADGGLFDSPQDVAVNNSGAGGVAAGTMYVVDSLNHRVQRLGPDGRFELAWGRDVIEPGQPNENALDALGFEVCDATDPVTPNDPADCQAGTVGGLGGHLSRPRGAAVDPDTGMVYVTDSDNQRVQQFTPDGDFVRAWGFDVVTNTGAPANANGTGFEVCDTTTVPANTAAECKTGLVGDGVGQLAQVGFRSPKLAVSPDGDPATGFVVVADPLNRRAQRFDLDGANPLVIGSSAIFGSTFSPRHLAVGLDGTIYAEDVGDARVERFDADGSPLAAGPLLGSLFSSAYPTPTHFQAEGLAVDPGSGNLLVVGHATTLGLDSLALEVGTPSSGSPVLAGVHMRGSGDQVATGLGVQRFGSVDRLLVSAESGVIGHRVLVLDEDGAGPLGVTADGVADLAPNSATLSGSVDPNGPTGFPTAYRFEYSEAGLGAWMRVPASDAVVGDQPAPVAVSQSVSGLDANTAYDFRLVAHRAFDTGNAVVVDGPGFTTLTAPPTVLTLEASRVDDSSAQLVGRLNPQKLQTAWHFQYLTQAAFDRSGWGAATSLPVPHATATGGSPQLVFATVNGLVPDTAYRYRLVASNGVEESPGDVIVEGDERTFRTRPAMAPPPGRAYEMVTPPDKPQRRGSSCDRKGFTLWGTTNACGATGLPSVSGERLRTWVFGASIDGTGVENGADWSPELFNRTPIGWKSQPILDVPPVLPISNNSGILSDQGLSADLSAHLYRISATPFESQSRTGLWLASGGGVGGSGWYDVIGRDLDLEGAFRSRALFSSRAERMVLTTEARGLLNDPSAPGVEDPSVRLDAGSRSSYFAEPPAGGLDDLVNECTGTGSARTQVPQRSGSGAATDIWGARLCGEGEMTSLEGGAVGTEPGTMSQDGKRLFFTSPEAESGVPGGSGSEPCDATGAESRCRPQVFVRQYDSDGIATVRWISRPDSAIGVQQIGQMGNGAYFEGASTDGRIVYFRTNAPLTVDDPNGGTSSTTGSASTSSWDLYRYVLPGGIDQNPAGGQLTRISGGPSFTSDPSTNRASSEITPESSVVRHLSDDGERVFFVTTSAIGGADNSIPEGGATAPGGAVGNASSRNLYMFDGRSTPARWRFVAQLPTNQVPEVDRCATLRDAPGFVAREFGLRSGGCVRGTSSGDAVVFESSGRLTSDDQDDASDVFVYDVDADRLSRASAPIGDQAPYSCNQTTEGADPSVLCNGDLGIAATGGLNGNSAFGGMEHYNLAENAGGGFAGLFFESALRLSRADVDSAFDVYEWRDGGVRLVSPVGGRSHALYSGNSRDGSSVFFLTRERIDPREIEPADHDIYVARVGGGFAYTPPGVVCDVLGDGCQGPGARAIPVIVSSRAPGGSNATPSRRAALALRRPSRKALRRAARRGVLVVSVRTSGAGLVRVTARARVAGRPRRIGSARKRAAKRGVVRLRVRLNRRARRALARRRALPIRLAASQPRAATKTRRLTLRRPR